MEISKKIIDELHSIYSSKKEMIQNRLDEFSKIPNEQYFYELAFCLMTPQSKAKFALEVQRKLQAENFYEIPFNPTDLLNNPDHYIRFHNQKSKYIIEMHKNFDDLYKIITNNSSAFDKRNILAKTVKGMGMKESSHFLRNIGFRELAILDRHILRKLLEFGGYAEIPAINTPKKYIETEQLFLQFAKTVNIPIDELDLMFWSEVTGEIIK